MAADNITKNDDDLFVEQISMQSNPRIASFVRDYIAAIRQENAAAPDMLAALRAAKTTLAVAGIGPEHETSITIRAAIAKVTTP